MPAGYSGTPLVRKLGVKPGHRVELDDAPAAWTVPGLPDGATLVRTGPSSDGGPADVVIAFVRELLELQDRIGRLSGSITVDGALWVAWPRRAGGHPSDITDNRIRDVVLPLGLVDVKVAALDEDWSGLKMVWRKERRAERRARAGG